MQLSPPSCALTSLELKALSVPPALLFLLGVEYDIFLCTKAMGLTKGFELHFPHKLSPSFRVLLESCAKRFGLSCRHFDGEESRSIIYGDRSNVPLLRYADYLPGGLHVDEILTCFGMTDDKLPAEAKKMADTEESKSTRGRSSFVACFVDYSKYHSDDTLQDVHGLGFYQSIDFGLSLATHAHLIQIALTPISETAANQTIANKGGKNAKALNTRAKVADALEASLNVFREFSGWERFDLRFEDESKRTGVLVMRTIQDASDLLEKYEDEESDTEGEGLGDTTSLTAAAFRLPFHLRPVVPTGSVPFMEESTLRRLRSQHWNIIVDFWAKHPANKNTVVVSNLYDGATAEEVVQLFKMRSTVTCVSMVEDDSPMHRRRAFVTFGSSDETREALGQDGLNTHGKALRVQVAPPYVDPSRRGNLVGTPLQCPPTSANPEQQHDSTTASRDGTTSAPTALSPEAPVPAGKPTLNAAAKEYVPKFMVSGGTSSPPPPYTPTPATGAPVSALPPAYHTAVNTHHHAHGHHGAPPPPPPPPAPSAGAPPYVPYPAYHSTTPTSTSSTAQGMPPYSLPPPYTGGSNSSGHGAPPPGYVPPK